MNNAWTEVDAALEKTFVFADFAVALAFVNRVGAIAEELQHHPDICIRAYKTVVISTTTHDAGNRVTEKDRILAAAIDSAELHAKSNT